MPSTLTAGVKDGKQSKKIERNTRQGICNEILLLMNCDDLQVVCARFERCAIEGLSAGVWRRGYS